MTDAPDAVSAEIVKAAIAAFDDSYDADYFCDGSMRDNREYCLLAALVRVAPMIRAPLERRIRELEERFADDATRMAAEKEPDSALQAG
jgi:hypothetical protein